MKVTKYIMIFSLIAGYSLAQAQQRPIYKAKPLSPEDISRKQHIPEWQPPTTRVVRDLPAGVNNSTLKYLVSAMHSHMRLTGCLTEMLKPLQKMYSHIILHGTILITALMKVHIRSWDMT